MRYFSDKRSARELIAHLDGLFVMRFMPKIIPIKNKSKKIIAYAILIKNLKSNEFYYL
jgi:hypothetical protein